MEIPEIQYRPEAPSANFAPVEQIDYTRTMQANHDKVMRDMNQRLQQIERNGQVNIQNAKNKAFPVEALAQFSKTLGNVLQGQIDRNKENDLAEGAMLAFTEGMGVDPGLSRTNHRLLRLVVRLTVVLMPTKWKQVTSRLLSRSVA